MSAADEKAKGNAAMGLKDFDTAVEHYSAAIALSPADHVLYSNRSAAYVSAGKFEEALADGEKTIELKSDWAKGYSRKGLALFKLERISEATECYQEGLRIDPENAALKSAMKEIDSVSNAGFNMFANMFNSPNFWTMLQTDPELKGYLLQEDFVQIINQIQQNPSTLNMYMQDKRVMAVITKLLTSQMGGAPGAYTAPPAASTPTQEAPKEAEPEEVVAEPEVASEIQQALDEKAKGNVAYKAKDFDTAISHYDKAIELNPKEMSFLTNRAAANFEAKDFSQCIADCEKAVEVGRSQYAPYEQIAKAYSRIGSAYRKQGDFGKALDAYNTSLTENRSRETQKIIRQLEKEKEKKEKEAYLDPVKALEAKQKGNEAFQAGKFPDAIRSYTEAIGRDPSNAPFYSNRAAAYMKLADFGLAFKDCEKCIELDPTFVKAYKRKAMIHNFKKEYHKAIETYKMAKTFAPDDADLDSGIQNAAMLISKANADPVEREARQKRAMQDPDIQRILQNPMVDQLLKNLSAGGDQATAMRMMAEDPSLKDSFDKLVASGAVALG